METGKEYKKAEIEQFHKKNCSHHAYVYGVNADNHFYIKFGQFEFWETEVDHVFKCTRNEEGYLVNPVEAFSFHDKARRKTKAYWTRDTADTREAKKWGYRPNG
jgi:hypothetical protein